MTLCVQPCSRCLAAALPSLCAGHGLAVLPSRLRVSPGPKRHSFPSAKAYALARRFVTKMPCARVASLTFECSRIWALPLVRHFIALQHQCVSGSAGLSCVQRTSVERKRHHSTRHRSRRCLHRPVGKGLLITGRVLDRSLVRCVVVCCFRDDAF